jgi:hypothetical protein
LNATVELDAPGGGGGGGFFNPEDPDAPDAVEALVVALERPLPAVFCLCAILIAINEAQDVLDLPKEVQRGSPYQYSQPAC